MIGLRIIDAVVIVLKENGSLTSKEAYEKIIEKVYINPKEKFERYKR